ncbi:SHOCT domain-containing protein [Sporomusa sp.]|uniref:SHOCT domain-containing protein n=1 Tax=Sporomusa sp. TaxID=2078658 RepID=UPI002C39FE89|nr:SHOCT domain-containing protein [Sporomusa sp.]HWR43451.1 SHOCT domain-containing protein [Sporomusa sp.]
MGYGMMGYAGQGYGYGTSLFGGFFHSVFSLLYWGLLLAGLYFLVRWLIEAVSGKSACLVPAAPVATLSALEILKQRYARGEISCEEFERIKQDLA